MVSKISCASCRKFGNLTTQTGYSVAHLILAVA